MIERTTGLLFSFASILVLGGCSVSEQPSQPVTEKVIEKRPEQFIQTVNNVAKKAQEAELYRRELELKAQKELELKAQKKSELKAQKQGQLKPGESKASQDIQ